MEVTEREATETSERPDIFVVAPDSAKLVSFQMSYYAALCTCGRPQPHLSCPAVQTHQRSFVVPSPTPPFLEPQDSRRHVTETFVTIEEANEFREEAKATQQKYRLAYQAWSRHVTRHDLRHLGTIILKTITDAREKKADACHVLIEPCPDAAKCDQPVHKKQKRLLELC